MLRWMMPQISLDVIELTLVPSASKTVILNDFTAPFACVVDWGDNTFSAISANVPLSHTYADASPRTVILRGSLGGFWNNSSATGKTLLTAVNTIKSRSLLSLSNTFRACTSLNSVVSSFDAPNLNNLQYSFYQCASITSALPPLWQAFPGVAHAGCFTQSCKSCWAQYGTACGHRQYVAAVPGRTYWQQFATGCSKRGYVAAVPGTLAYDYYNKGVNCGSFNPTTKGVCRVCGRGYGTASSGLCNRAIYCPDHRTGHPYPTACCPITCPNEGFYVGGSAAYYTCTSGGNCKDSGCTITYTSGQSAYYRCAKSGASCATSGCVYPYANENSYNAARNAGWA